MLKKISMLIFTSTSSYLYDSPDLNMLHYPRIRGVHGLSWKVFSSQPNLVRLKNSQANRHESNWVGFGQ